MKRDQPKIALRCAVYARVSTDSGLEQDFNFLDNQREPTARCGSRVGSERAPPKVRYVAAEGRGRWSAPARARRIVNGARCERTFEFAIEVYAFRVAFVLLLTRRLARSV